MIAGTVEMVKLNTKKSRSKDQKVCVGKIEAGQWLCQLSLMLGTTVSCDYVSDSIGSTFMLSISRELYDETIGKVYKHELNTAMHFLS